MVDDLLHPVPGEHPIGVELRGSEEWELLTHLRRNREWAELRKNCARVLRSLSKDPQVALWWTEASTHLEGVHGLAEGIQLVGDLLSHFGEALLQFGVTAEGKSIRDRLKALADVFEICLLQIPLADSPFTLTTVINARFDKELETEIQNHPSLHIPWSDLRMFETAFAHFEQVIDKQGGAGGALADLKDTLADIQRAFSRWSSRENRTESKSDEVTSPPDGLPAPDGLEDRHQAVRYDIYLWVESIPGESVDGHYRGWMECTAYRQSLSRPQASNQEPQPRFEIEKELDRASPALYQAVNSGRVFPTVIVEVSRRFDQRERLLRIEMHEAVIAEVHQTASAASERSRPSEVIVFEYGRIHWTYTKLQAKGFREGNTSGSSTYARPVTE